VTIDERIWKAADSGKLLLKLACEIQTPTMKHRYSSNKSCPGVGHVLCPTETHIITMNYMIFLNY